MDYNDSRISGRWKYLPRNAGTSSLSNNQSSVAELLNSLQANTIANFRGRPSKLARGHFMYTNTYTRCFRTKGSE